MLNSISRACIQQAVHAGSLYVYTTISVVLAEFQFLYGTDYFSAEVKQA